MTYKELFEQMKNWDNDQLERDLTILDSFEDEFYPITNVFFAKDEDTLDEGHPYFTF